MDKAQYCLQMVKTLHSSWRAWQTNTFISQNFSHDVNRRGRKYSFPFSLKKKKIKNCQGLSSFPPMPFLLSESPYIPSLMYRIVFLFSILLYETFFKISLHFVHKMSPILNFICLVLCSKQLDVNSLGSLLCNTEDVDVKKLMCGDLLGERPLLIRFEAASSPHGPSQSEVHPSMWGALRI